MLSADPRHRLAMVGGPHEQVEAVMMTLALTIEARDPYTRGHGDRLADYAAAVGRNLGLAGHTITTLYWGALLHDIGKVGIPDAILLTPGRLTPAEYEVMKQHTIIGDEVCRPFVALNEVRRVVRHHHERLDGTGYPDRLRGAAVPLTAQIVGIVDLFDAVTTCRPHQPARSIAEAISCLYEEVARGWRDRVLVDAFVRTLVTAGETETAA